MVSVTNQIVMGVVKKLSETHQKEIAVEYFPETPGNYRLNHATGAVLVGYSRSLFSSENGLGAVWVRREMTIPLTLMFRQLHGKAGAIEWLDKLRNTLTGWKPPHCDCAMLPSHEAFLIHQTGVWQYALEFVTQTVQVQQDF